MLVMVAADSLLMAGAQACVPAPEAFLRVLKPPASPLRTPPVMPQDDRGRCDRHPSVDPGGVAHGHHGCLWATLPGSISAWSFIPWSLRFAQMTRGYRAMKPPASTPAQPATGIYLYPMNRFGVKKIKAFGLHIPSQTHLEHRRVDLTANPSSYNVKCRGMNYILLMIPSFVELMKSTIFRISGLSGTCSLICNTASNTLV